MTIHLIPRVAFAALTALALATALTACATSVPPGSYGAELDSVPGDAWVEDLDELARLLESRHPNPFHTTGRDEFMEIVTHLQSQAAGRPASRGLADAMVAGVYRALAVLEEGHTTVNASPRIQYPALIRRFRTKEGGWELRVAYSDESLPQIPGARVTAVGGRDPFAVLDEVSLLASAELPGGRLFFGQRLLTYPRIMRGLGLAGERLELTVEPWSPEGGPAPEDPAAPDDPAAGTPAAGPQSVTVALAPLPIEQQSLRSPSAPADTTGERSISFSGSGAFWYEQVGGTLYFRYNRSTTEATTLMNEIIRLVESGGVQRLVLDLRFNGGGNSLPGTRFVRALAGTPIGREPGRFYVLISENTFSSAIMTAVDAMEMTQAIFVGTPMVTPVDAWGEVRLFALPNSGLVIGHSTRFWEYTRGKELRLADGVVVPDPGWEALWTFDEWVRGYDPALELILAAPLP